ncbi:hypothetical protein BU16DRAFT_554193 [Lophium mytilinum]|uniref:Uncharacterized protein n=1 Tax=Lophium mytilinum TaxID=390894 RepID=A0A6A6RC31_9PEZI|nr:hypothetical protein BU16DRAFT_554193 [Lophium mytilinum]
MSSAVAFRPRATVAAAARYAGWLALGVGLGGVLAVLGAGKTVLNEAFVASPYVYLAAPWALGRRTRFAGVLLRVLVGPAAAAATAAAVVAVAAGGEGEEEEREGGVAGGAGLVLGAVGGRWAEMEALLGVARVEMVLGERVEGGAVEEEEEEEEEEGEEVPVFLEE